MRHNIPLKMHCLTESTTSMIMSRANLSHSLNLASVQTHWSIVDSVISDYTSDESLEIEVLKTVGMLNLLNANDLLPTATVIVQAVAGTREDLRTGVGRAIDTLNEKQILYNRGIAGGLCLWPHTSVGPRCRL